jgi:hypothetical protein
VVRITDSGNRIGEANVTVPSRKLTLSNASSKRGSSITFDGSGFIASTTVTVTYAGTTVATVTADSAGNVAGSFTVPNSAGIPSSNTVAGASACTSGTPTGNVCTQLSGVTTHKVPGATVTADPSTSSPGENINVSGTGFPGFVALSTLTIGGVSALPAGPATDGDGIFSISALVPQLAAGSHSLVATVGTGTTGVTATSSFTITSAPTTPSSAAPATALAELITANTLDVVWLFNSTTKQWQFFDPDPALAAFNDVTSLVTGEAYDFQVTEDTTVTLNGKVRTLTCVDGNCWNRIVW